MGRMLVAFGLVVAVASPALAQTDPVAQAHLVAANQLGLLQNCKAQGYVGDDAIAAERTSIARMPSSPVMTDAAEAAGKGGTLVAPNGTRTSLAAMATGQKTSVADLCKRMGDGVVQAAKMMQSGLPAGTSTGMPQMPAGMPSFSGVPSMSGMPTMPGMPTAPGAPARR